MKKNFTLSSSFCWCNLIGKSLILLTVIALIGTGNAFGQTNCDPDTEAPVVINPPSNVSVQCEEDVPPAPDVMFTDNCDTDLDIFFHETGPAAGSEKCILSDAAGPNPGVWSVWLPNLPNGITDSWIFDPNELGCLDIYDNGTAHMTGKVYAANNPSMWFIIDVWIKDKLDWNSWSSMLTTSPPFINRSFKDDGGFAAAGGNLWETWDYYVVDGSQSVLIGGGALSGSYLQLVHAPANLFFGVQVGDAANNKNANYGLSTWFTYTGFFNINGQVNAVSGLGDFNMDLDCGPNTLEQCEFEIERIWIAVDDFGNSTTVTQTITVNDDTPPELTGCPENIAVECDNIPEPATVTADDNCDGPVDVTFTETIQGGSCPDEYTILRQWTAIDECGNQVDCFQTITVSDTTAPELSPAQNDLTLSCSDEIPVAADLTATDNCDDQVDVIFNESTLAGNCPNEFQIFRTWTATDDCGNETVENQTITIIDNTNPILTGVPVDVVVECDNIPMVPVVNATDNCGGAMINFEVETIPEDDCTYFIVRTWTAIDACGNSSSASQTITVVDSTAPVFELDPEDETVDCDNIPSPLELGATDNCSAVTVTFDEIQSGQGCNYTLLRLYTATDECGNSSSVSQTITVVDTEAPVLSGGDAGGITLPCDDPSPYIVTPPVATDNCEEEIAVIENTQAIPGICTGLDGTLYTWTATDLCGNTSVQTFTIQYVDTEAPVLSECPEDITIECEGDLPEAPVVTATDNCDEDVEVSFVEFLDIDGSEATCEATEAIGSNPDYWSVWLPNLPGGITDQFVFDADGGSFNVFEDYAVFTGTVHAIDNPNQIFFVNLRVEDKKDWATWSSMLTISPPFINRSFKDDAGFAEAGGDLWETWEYYVVDETSSFLIGAGEFAGSYLSLTHAPANLLFGVQVGQAANNVNANYGMSTWFLYSGFLNGEEIDGLGDVNVDLSCEPGNELAKCDFDVNRVWIATDDCGNSTACKQTINIIDTTPPVFDNDPEDITVSCEDADDVVTPECTATDNCGEEVTITYDEEVIPGDCPYSYSIEKVWIAADCCGNTSSVTQTVTVIDDTPPVIVAPADQQLECGSDIPDLPFDASDNCGDVVVNFSDEIENTCGETYIIYRTYTATDECGNTSSDLQTITFVDTTSPQLSVAADLFLECDEEIPAPSYTATDSCGEVTVTIEENQEGDCETTISRLYTAVDECGNTTTGTQTITIVDSTAPTLTVPDDLTLECGEEIPAPDYEADDNCNEVTVVVTPEVTDQCGETFTMVRTFVATDACGNSTTATQTITVIDTTAPELFIDQDYTLECGDTIPQASYDAFDICGTVNVIVTEEQEDTCGETFVLYRTYTATDECGNSTSATQTITTIDTIPPSLTIGQDTTVECGDPIPGSTFIVDDSCGEVDIILSQTQVMTCGETYILTRQYTATDECGNATMATQIITVVDTTAPELEIPADITIECGDSIPEPAYTASDICGAVSVTVVDENEEGCGNTYTIYRTFIATDECGNETSATQVITIEDTTPPTITAAEDLILECDQPLPDPSYTANDTCGDVSVTLEVSETGGCENVITRTYTATDACGNTSQDVQVITVVDTTPPTLTVGADGSFECDEEIPAPSYDADDNCNEVTVTYTEGVISGECPQEFVLVRVYMAVDACGNQTSAVQTINISDNTPPVLYPPQNLIEEVDCTVINGALLNAYANNELPQAEKQAFFQYAVELFNEYDLIPTEAEDNCDENPQISEFNLEALNCDEVECPAIGQLECSFVAVDDCGNESNTITTIITLIDEDAPVLEGVPADETVECDAIPEAAIVTAFDDCFGEEEVTMTESMQPGDCPDSYIIVRTWNASDKCENTASATQIITVTDTTAPIFDSVPEDMTAECDNVPGAAELTATDNCDDEVDISVEEIITEGDCEDSYTITYIYTAVDNCENSTMHTQTIEVSDTTPPVFDEIPPVEITVPCDSLPDPGLVTATDNCDDDVTIMFMENVFSGSCAGVLEWTWIAKDNCGNESIAIQYVTLVDDVAPSFSGLPDDITIECDEDIPPAAQVTVNDNCGQTMLTYGEQTFPGECPQEYSIVRTYTAVDECENMASVSYTIHVVDTTAPEFTFVGEDLIIECDQELPDPNSQAIDNCGEVSVEVVETSVAGDCPQEYTLTRTYTATDECGNSATAEQVINVVDTTPPSILDVPEAETLECDDDLRAPDLGAYDNCADSVDVQFEEEIIPGDCVGSFTIIRYWSATDDCGNSVTESQEVTVVDTTAPEFIEGPADETVECDNIPEAGIAVFEDNCDENITLELSEETEPGQCPQNYFIIRTWTATDDCGNSNSYTQTITVVDTTAPELSVAADVTVECDEDIPAPEFTANDNCGEVEVQVSETEEGDTCELVLSRTYTATDECGNSISLIQLITIVDTTAPFIQAAEDLTLECGEQLPEPSFIAEDNCNDYQVEVESEITEGCGETFTMVRTYTATDLCGNTSSDTQTITVIDTTAPELSIGEDYTLECGTEVPEPSYDAIDTCGEVTVEINEETEDTCGLTYILYRTYTATDECGNAASAVQTITFIDTTPPSLTVGADTTVECGDPVPGSMFVAEDSCGEVSVILSQTQQSTCGGTYILTRQYTATDECGNETMATQIITIVDTTDPYFSSPMPEDVEVECDMIPEVPEIGPDGITADDICSDVTIDMAEQIIMGDCENSYVILRTWTATDDCDNMTSYTQTISVVDTTAPVFGPIDLQIEAPCDSIPPAEDIVVTDNCDSDLEIIYEESFFSGGCIGVIERTWTAIDNCGNSSSILQYVTLTDDVPPVLSDNPEDETYGCNDEVPPAPVLTAIDNCDDNPAVTYSEEILEGDCPQEYFILRTWTASDDCDNVMSYTQTITVTDLEAPVFTYVAGDVTMECSDELPNIGAKAQDDCGSVLITQNIDTIPGDCPQNITLQITFTATDDCGNSATAMQTIEILDTTPPVISGVPDDVTVLCGNIPEAAEITAADNCGEVIIELDESGYNGTDCSGTLTRTWTATDECGNSSSASQVITIIDDIAPELSDNPENMLVECDSVPEAVLIGATDNCDDDVEVVFSEDIIEGNCEDSYLIVRTWTATDDCGNSTSHQQNIDVVDTTTPEFVDLPEIEIFPNCDSIPDPDEIMAIDNCDLNVEISLEEELLSGGCQGTMKRTWTATDNCGNTNVFEQFLFFQDNTAPEIIVPADYTIECDEDLLPFEEAAYTDNCDDELDVMFNETLLPGLCEDAYFLVRTWTVTDNCDNSSTDSQTISVVDTTAPVLSDEPADATVECDAVPEAALITASDNCSEPEVSFTESIADGDCEDSYIITRTWSAEDDCGNAVSHTQTITVIDATAPTLLGDFGNELVQCNNVPGLPEVSAEDNCDDDVEIAFLEMITQGSCIDNYTITRTWTATDNCGNSSTAVQVINVVDTTDPFFFGLPADVTVECDDIPDVPNVGGTDNCDTDVDITFSQYGWDGSCEGTLFREWTATDNCGNTATYIQEITIIDTTAPEFNTPLPADIEVECNEVPEAAVLTAIDNCGVATVEFSEDMEQGDCENAYTLYRLWVATDECGNSTSHTQTIYVDDTTAPVLDTLPADITVECTDVPEIESVGATDNCDNDVTVTVEEVMHSGGCVGVIERAWTATDNCGNTAQYSQFITLLDTTAPEFTNTPADLTVECDSIPQPEVVEATDNCFDGAFVFFDETIDGDGCEYDIIRTWTAVDSCNNQSVHVQIITVMDTTAPEFIFTPADETVSCDDIPEAPQLSATDNCSEVEIIFGEVTTDGCPYSIERTWTATDACGNSTSYTQTLSVVDEVAPTFVNPPQDITDDCNADPEIPSVEVVDNCDENINMTMSMSEVITDCETIITRTWTATDACGNISMHTQTVTLIDTTAPEFDTNSVPADVSVECDEIPKPSTPTATDDCHDVTITLQEDILTGEGCPGDYMIIRTWTASDGCGNTSSVAQMIDVSDTTPPEFISFPADETYICGDEIPEAETPVVADNCSSVTLTLEETIVGQTELNPPCELFTPVQNVEGEEWSVFLPGVASGFFILDENNGVYQEVDLGGGITEGVFSGRIYDSADTCKAFFIDGYMINKLDWDTWSSLLTITPPFINRTFKDQGGFAAAIGPDTHESWEYWELDGTRTKLIGDGCYAGDTLALSHAPSNLFYGFQLGLAANNRNGVYGMGTWFTFDGTVEGQPVSGSGGDFAFRNECPPCEYTITRTWTAEDDCGNISTMTQTITVNDPNTEIENPISDNDYDSDVSFDNNQPDKNFKFKISADPNPTFEKSTITFSMNQSGFAMLEVFSLSGKKVDHLFSGNLEKDQIYRFDFNGESLSQGVYIYRMTTHQKVITDKLILTK